MTAPALADDIHQRVLALAWELVDASAGDDRRTHWRLHGELRAFCETTAAAGRDHPFLWETLADFTADPAAAVPFYQRALALAEAAAMGEYQASIGIALAERLDALGRHAEAWAQARKADAQAMQTDDLDLRRQISQFLLERSTAQ